MTFGESATLFDEIRKRYCAPELMDVVVSLLDAAPGKKLIDIGCGTGISARELAAHGYEITGVDADADMIDVAAAQHATGRYCVMRAEHLDFASEAFSAATAFSSFHWLTGLINVRPHVPSGRVRALAITAMERSSAALELPTIAEAGVLGYVIDQWYGVITGAKVPPAIIKKLNAGIVEALKSTEVAQRLAGEGSTVKTSSPREFDAYIHAEIAKWGRLVKDAKLDLRQ